MSDSLVYNFLRFVMLPLSSIDEALPKKGKIYELGCGQGVISKYLAKNKFRNVYGIDKDCQRIPKQGLKNLKFICRDIRKINFLGVHGIVISDVLHHLNFEDQKNLLQRISRSFKKDCVLVIKEIDAQEFIRSRLSRFWDFIFYPQDKIYYMNSSYLKIYLRKLKFSVNFKRASKLFPGSTNLYICKKN